MQEMNNHMYGISSGEDQTKPMFHNIIMCIKYLRSWLNVDSYSGDLEWVMRTFISDILR